MNAINEDRKVEKERERDIAIKKENSDQWEMNIYKMCSYRDR